MTVKYYAILTNQGAARLANATMLGSKLNLTRMAVGDANGVLPTPDPAQTKLINQKRIAPLNLLSVDPNNQSQIIAEQIIPESEGGFWIREIGLYDDKGVLIAVANCPETYKPQLQEGSGRTQTIRMILVVTNTKAITLKIDPSVVLATRKYVDDKISKHEQSRRHPDASLTAKGFVQLSSATDSQSETEAATPKAVKIAYDLARGKYTAQDATTTRKGIVQLSSAINSTSEILAATPKAVKAAYDLANGKQPADATLTALAGLVTAADRLPYFTGADRAALATLTAIGRAIIAKGSIKDVLNYLGLGEGSPAIGVPFFWPSAAMPDTVIKSWSSMVFLKFNGAKFSASDYPVLAKVFPSLVLPEARGDFIRIWDDGRGADGGRKLLSWQAATNFSQFAGNIGGGAGHAINFHDGIAGNQPGFSRFNFTSNSLGDGVNFVAVRPRNIAFNFLVRAK